MDESSFLRLDPDEKLKLDEQDSISLNSKLPSSKTIEIPTKAYIDSIHQENEGNRGDLGLDFYDESNDLVKNIKKKFFDDSILTNLDRVSVNKIPLINDEVSSKKKCWRFNRRWYNISI